jgi:anti-anti-sigma factor
MHGDELHVDVDHSRGYTHVTIRGEIDIVSVPALRTVLDELSVDQRVVIDMAGVRFMDSSGVNALIAHAVRATAGGGSLRVCNPSRAVERVVQLTGVNRLLAGNQSFRRTGA